MRTAGVIGSTGLVGSKLVQLLLAEPEQLRVKTLVRNATQIQAGNYEETTGDLLNLEAHSDWFRGLDFLFVCVGTTASKTPDQLQYKAIDFGIPLQAATWAKHHGNPVVVVVSAAGADPSSKIFYSRLKGEMEEAVSAVGLERIHFARPSLLLGNREEFRLGERIGQVFMKLFSWLIPASYQAIEGEEVARAMWAVANKEKAPKLLKNALLLQLGNKG